MVEQEHWKDWVAVHNIGAEEVVLKDPKLASDLPPDEPVMAILGVGVIPDSIVIYCLPMVVREEVDPVYGEKRQVPGYGDQFTFEGIMTDYTGVTASFFCRLPTLPLAGSILHVRKERQWWKVVNSFVRDDGIAIDCVPSDRHPSFS
jgi:hypothetical protein